MTNFINPKLIKISEYPSNFIPANSQVGIYFEVAVTPTSAQLDQNIKLTNSTQFSATDNFVNKNFCRMFCI